MKAKNQAWKMIDPDTEWTGQLLDAQAESAGIDSDTVSFTPELQKAWNDYSYDLRQALGDWIADNGLDPDLLQEMYDADAEYNVYMTLRGHGVGIWDGRWGHILTKKQIEDLTDYLTGRLSVHVDDTGGGRVEQEMDDAVYRGRSANIRRLKRSVLA